MPRISCRQLSKSLNFLPFQCPGIRIADFESIQSGFFDMQAISELFISFENSRGKSKASGHSAILAIRPGQNFENLHSIV